MIQLQKENIILDIEARSKDGVLKELAGNLHKHCTNVNIEDLYQVLRDREQIAVLSACGFRRGHIFLMYAFYGGFVALCGIIPGTLLGYGLLKYFESYPIFQIGSSLLILIFYFIVKRVLSRLVLKRANLFNFDQGRAVFIKKTCKRKYLI